MFAPRKKKKENLLTALITIFSVYFSDYMKKK